MSIDHALINFPDPRFSSFEDIVAVGGELNTANLVRAYRLGIFPWPIDEHILPWCCPEQRAILEFNDLHVSRRLTRIRRQTLFHFSIDRSFEEVIFRCATIERKEESGTWITPQIVSAYCELHRAGHAHSVEVWEGGTLVGGLYGVDGGGAFSGESMFSDRSDASKLALLFLIEHLKQRGLDWMDIQVMSPHMKAFGAKEIDRSEFVERLSLAQNRNLVLFPL